MRARSYSYYTYSRQKATRFAFEKSKETDLFKLWRRDQYAAQSGHCAWCYKEVAYRDMDVDHIKAVSLGGTNDFSNLLLACRNCNRELKFNTAYNQVAYDRTLGKLSYTDRILGLTPQKIYWERPKWIRKNRFSKEPDYQVEDIPFEQRNVWTLEAPIQRNLDLQERLHSNIHNHHRSLPSSYSCPARPQKSSSNNVRKTYSNFSLFDSIEDLIIFGTEKIANLNWSKIGHVLLGISIVATLFGIFSML